MERNREARYTIVVHRGHEELFTALQGVGRRVHVIWDRRTADRRSGIEPTTQERRNRDRRQIDVDGELPAIALCIGSGEVEEAPRIAPSPASKR